MNTQWTLTSDGVFYLYVKFIDGYLKWWYVFILFRLCHNQISTELKWKCVLTFFFFHAPPSLRFFGHVSVMVNWISHSWNHAAAKFHLNICSIWVKTTNTHRTCRIMYDVIDVKPTWSMLSILGECQNTIVLGSDIEHRTHDKIKAPLGQERTQC